MIGKTNALTISGGGGGGGGGSTYQRPADWLAIPTMSGTTDDIYILNGVIKNGMNMLYFIVSGTGTIDWGDGSATETFTNASQTTYSHHFDYADVSSSTWTDHNKSRQVLVHISGNRGAITYFSTAGITYQYTNADNVTVDYNGSTSTDIYQISANVGSCEVYCGTNSGQRHKKLEIFDWNGTITNTNMSNMFYYCHSLQTIPQLDTSSVTNMQNMFDYCYSLQTIPQFDTSSVTDMSNMFSRCYSLQTIPQLNTKNVTSMYNMFSNCSSLQTIPQLDTSSVTNMYGMFNYCYSLQTIPQLDTSSVTNMYGMFNYCYSLQTIPQLDTSNVTDMTYMFGSCQSLQTIPQFDTSSVTSMYYMFSNCSSLQTIPQLDTSNVTNMYGMFSGCYSLQTIPQLNTKNVTNMQTTFAGCYSLQTIPQLNMSSVTNMTNALNACNSLQSVKLYNLNKSRTSAITLSNLTYSTMLTKQAILDIFNAVPANPSGTRTIQLGNTLKGRLGSTYVKDSGQYYTAIIPTSDTSIQAGKTYYTYDQNTDTYTQVTPDFTSDTFYYELSTATWNEYVMCESTDTGATLILTWIANKGYTIT